MDFEKAGPIVDDEIHEILVAGLPQGVRLTAIMDCCHSGSVFDLPYTVRTFFIIAPSNMSKELVTHQAFALHSFSTRRMEIWKFTKSTIEKWPWMLPLLRV